MTADAEAPRPKWTVALTCCGYDDGTFTANTYEEADAFREAYTSGPGVSPHGYSTESYVTGHRRSGVVSRAE
jgi:hypothetical protein